MRPTASPTCPTEREQLQRPVVYHLLGRLSASPTYVISDEDMLEFICALQSEHLTPEKLFHELEHNHLLFIGSSFTNWLARLFLRMAKRHRLSDPRDVGEVLADRPHRQRRPADERSCSRSACARASTAAPRSFVDELHRRWTARHKPARRHRARRGAAALPAAGTRDAGQRRLHQLRARGPARGAAAQGRARRRRDRTPGSTWSASKAATTTTARSSATSRAAPSSSRWSRPRPSAGSRRTSAANGATRSTARATSPTARCSSCRCASTTRTPATRRVPEKFKAVHFTRLPGGEVTPEFARRLQDLLSQAHAVTGARPAPGLTAA